MTAGVETERGAGQVQDPGPRPLRRAGPREGTDDHRVHRPGGLQISLFYSVTNLTFDTENFPPWTIYNRYIYILSVQKSADPTGSGFSSL